MYDFDKNIENRRKKTHKVRYTSIDEGIIFF